MLELLRLHPLWLLFFVTTIGFALDRIPWIHRTMGIATVLFVGLAVGATDPSLRIPKEVYELGLVLFVYTVGLSCGPSFFRTMRKGFANHCLVTAMTITVAAAIWAIATLLDLTPATSAGLFTGVMTNTPALASVTELLSHSNATQAILAEPVIGYSLAYPISILSVIVSIRVVTKYLKTDYSSEAKRLIAFGVAGDDIKNVTVRVMRDDLAHIPIGVLFVGNNWRALLGRRLRGASETLVLGDTYFERNDLVSVIGTQEDIDPIVQFLGLVEPEVKLGMDRGRYDNRRIFLSDSKHFGRKVADLNLLEKYEAMVTRVRRGDNDYLASAGMILEPGDRLRIVAPRTQMKAISNYLGDSYRSLSEIDFLSLSLGLLMGFALGQVPLPAPAGYELKLGLAGGPLVASLLLGWFGRTGPFVWTLPFGANLTLRQLGMVMFLAGVGTHAGSGFIASLLSGGWIMIAVSGIVVFTASSCTLLLGHLLLKIPMSVMIGILAGMQTQPALLSYATQQTGNDSPNIGYASVYPIAMIIKILLAQGILVVMSSRV